MPLLHVALAFVLQPSALAIDGYVTDDATGLPIHGARVELPEAKVWAVTDSLGYYALHADRVGAQRVRVVRLGYESHALQVLLPSLGSLRVDIALRATPAVLLPLVIWAPPVMMNDARAGPLSDTRWPDVRRFSAAQLTAHPVLAEADVLTAFAAAHDVSIAPESPTSFHVRGGSSDQLRFLIDGIPFYNPAHGAGMFGGLNSDAVESVALHTGARTAAFGGALAATLDAQTRRPDSAQLHFRGGVSATTVRLTIDGPVVPGRSDFVLSARRGSPALFAGRPDRTRLAAAFGDWLVKSATRVGSGTVTLLAMAAADRTGFSRQAEIDGVAPASPDRHSFDWGGTSVAALYTAALQSGTQLNATLWRADFYGDATWRGSTPLNMTSGRHSIGLQSSLVRQRPGRELRLGVDLLHDRVAYRVHDEQADAEVAPRSLASGRESSLALYTDYTARVDTRWDVRPGARAVFLASGPLLLEPRLSVAFRATPTLSIGAGVAHVYQTVQSLRNPESPASSVFGADLPVLALDNIPIGRSDEATLGVEARGGEQVRLTLDAYARRLTGLVLVAPGSGVPFALSAPSVGEGSAWGLGTTLDVRLNRLTTHLTGGVGRTRLRVSGAESEADGSLAFQPGFATTHSVTGAVAYRLGNKTTLRSAVFARWGRRATMFDGALDWEGCDVLDGGCQIAGSPTRAVGAVASAQLPAYLRWDIGARRGWTTQLAGRGVELEAHATLRNLLDRHNVWGFTTHETGAPQSLKLRPLSVLTAGLDFRY
jgi:hypothetical protein